MKKNDIIHNQASCSPSFDNPIQFNYDEHNDRSI